MTLIGSAEAYGGGVAPRRVDRGFSCGILIGLILEDRTRRSNRGCRKWSNPVRRTMLGGKIHRATVTDANLGYEGSVTIDQDLLEAADILEGEAVDVWDVTNGARLTTYALTGPRASGVVCMNGAAAHLVHAGDLVIIANFVSLDEAEARCWQPSVVFVDIHNRPVETRSELLPMVVPSEDDPPSSRSELIDRLVRSLDLERLAVVGGRERAAQEYEALLGPLDLRCHALSKSNRCPGVLSKASRKKPFLPESGHHREEKEIT